MNIKKNTGAPCPSAPETVKTIRNRIVLEGAKKYRQEWQEVRKEFDLTTKSVKRLNAELEKLSKSIKALAE